MSRGPSGARDARPQSVSPARRAALEVLTGVRTRDAYANLLLPVVLRRMRLAALEAAFATELTYGTLRRVGHYDTVIARASGRSIDRIDPRVLDVLRLAAHQLLATRTAPHAAVHQAVEQARGISRGAAGFANAVLRRVGEADDDEWTARLLAGVSDPLVRAALSSAHPGWIVAEFGHALAASVSGGGTADAELVALLAADNVPAQVTLAALPGLVDRADLPGVPHPLSPIGVILESGDPTDLPAVAAGAARVQDAGSQLAALALTRARPITAGERWLDLCAGPGGKAAVLAAEAFAGGAELVANEVLPARARLVERALAAVPGAHPVVVGDGARFGREPARSDGAVFDRILLDAPCSGLGALRRRPEARWRKQPDDLRELTALQARLLDAAILALRSGGLLAYVTCSPVDVETDAQITAALARHPGLVALDTGSLLARITGGAVTGAGRGSAAQLWPHRHGTDAMFIQLLTTA